MVSGLSAVREGLFAPLDGDNEKSLLGGNAWPIRQLLSGVCLEQSGLDSVHSLALADGAFFPIPRGADVGLAAPWSGPAALRQSRRAARAQSRKFCLA